MANSDQLSLDIALATVAHAMFASLLSPEEKKSVASLRSPEELIDLAAKNKSWGDAVSSLPGGDVPAEEFSAAVDRSVYGDIIHLYDFSTGSATEYLHFTLLRYECFVITAALRRLASPGEREHPVFIPPELNAIFKPELTSYLAAKSYADVLSLAGGSIYAKTLAGLKLDASTGAPELTEASLALEERYYCALSSFLKDSYTGPDRPQLLRMLAFRADMRNLGYLMRLRRFHTPGEKARELLLPLRGALTDKLAGDILEAADEESALELIFSALSPELRRPKNGGDAGTVLREALSERCRRAVRGVPTLSAVDSYIYLKQTEGEMLKRVYAALKYGLDPATYM